MATSIGDPLFAGRRLERYMEALPVETTNWARHYYDEEGLLGAALVARLRERFVLEPVLRGPVMTITVQARPWPYTSGSGEERTGFLAYAKVPWSGSKIFLQSRIDPAFRARFSAKIGKTALKLGRYVETLDLTRFRDDAFTEVERMRDVLATYRPQAVAFDQKVLLQVQRAVNADHLE